MKGLLKSAIRDDDPVLVFEDSALWAMKADVSTDPDFLIPIGKADIKRTGADVTLVAIAACVKHALAAAKELEREGVSAEVVDIRTLAPLDRNTILNSVAKTGRLVIIDNAHRTCSAAAEISAIVAEDGFDYLKRPIIRITTPDIHIPFSPALEKPLYPNNDKIVQAVHRLM